MPYRGAPAPASPFIQQGYLPRDGVRDDLRALYTRVKTETGTARSQPSPEPGYVMLTRTPWGRATWTTRPMTLQPANL